MARPTRDPEGKRKQVAVRFGPKELARLEELATEAAEKAGKKVSVGNLIETRVSALLSADARTFELLVAIADGVQEAEGVAAAVQDDHTRPIWHETLTAWAAVAEMLARGPIERMRPESVTREPSYIDAQREKAAILLRKRQIIKQLAVFGVSVSEEPTLEKKSVGGLFGAVMRYADLRSRERTMIEAIEDPVRRSSAAELHDEIIKLDEDEARENSEAGDMSRLYRDLEEMGRALYRKHNTEKQIANIMELAASLGSLRAKGA